MPDFYIGAKRGNSLNGFYIESTTIAGILERNVPVISQACLPANTFSDFFSLQLLIQLFVNAVDIETCIFLLDKLMEEGSIALIRGVVSLVSISEKHIKNGEHPLNILKTLTEKRIKPQLSLEYDKLKIEITESRVEKLRALAKELRAQEWHKCEKLALRKLEKCSNFNETEIKLLRDVFMDIVSQKEEHKSRNTVKLPSGLQEHLDKNQFEAGISKTQFIEMIAGINPHLHESASLIFDRFDDDKSGLLDFRELTICISIMCKGDFDEKLKVCFDAYDQDKSGFLQPNEMEALIESLIKPYKQEAGDSPTDAGLNIEEIKQSMRMICERNGDILCFRDFLSAVRADSKLYACFCDHFTIVGTDGIETLKTNTMKKERSDRSGQKMCQNCLIL